MTFIILHKRLDYQLVKKYNLFGITYIKERAEVKFAIF